MGTERQHDLLDQILEEMKGLRVELRLYAEQTTANTTDLAWVKRLVGGIGTTLLAVIGYLLKRVSGG